jgi:ATP-dependent Lon protease
MTDRTATPKTKSSPRQLGSSDGAPLASRDAATIQALRGALPRPRRSRADQSDLAETPDGDEIETSTEPDRPAEPGHYVMDRHTITEALLAAGYDGSFDTMSTGEEQRARTLVAYRDQPLWRRHLIGAPAMTVRLEQLGVAQPNFLTAIGMVRRAVTLSQISGSPLRIPPTILLGSPGCGKSRFVRALAACLGTTISIIDGATIPDVGSITGYPPAWKGAGSGRLARAILTANTSGPIIYIEEAEKIVDYEQARYPLDKILSLLDSSTAAAYMDENLQVPMRAQHATVLLSVNSLDGLSQPLLDRTIIFSIPDLDPDQRDSVLEAMLAEASQAVGLSVSFASRAALAPVKALGLRRARLALELAIALAVEHDRRFITATDVTAAVAMLRDPGRAAERQVGFIHRS